MIEKHVIGFQVNVDPNRSCAATRQNHNDSCMPDVSETRQMCIRKTNGQYLFKDFLFQSAEPTK